MDIAEILSLVIPANALQEVARLLDSDEVTLLVPQDTRQVLFAGEDWEVVAQLIEGNFPDYNAIIPDEYALSFSVDVAALKATLARANIYAREAANIVRFAVQQDDERVLVRAETAEMGDFEEPVPIVAGTEGPDVEVAFNSQYLAALLNALTAERVEWRLNSASSPGWFVPVPATGHKFTHVIMPMSIGR